VWVQGWVAWGNYYLRTCSKNKKNPVLAGVITLDNQNIKKKLKFFDKKKKKLVLTDILIV
jgi:hypothetical protein